MPAPIDAAQQAVLDDEHLRLLTIGFYVSAAMTAFVSLAGLFYAAMGFFIGAAVSHTVRNAAESAQGADNAVAPQFIGALFGIIGLVIFVVALAFAGAKVYAALCLKRRRGRTFCLVIAAISCLEVPWGTLLGVFTIIVLERPTVSRQFLPINAVAPRPPLPPYIPPAAGL
jgi:hypothetical protein